MKIIILPLYKAYKEIQVEADKIAIAFSSQLSKNYLQKTFFIDSFINQEIGDRYNQKIISEMLNYQSNKEKCNYRGISLLDIDIRNIGERVLEIYKQVLSLITFCVEFNPSVVGMEKKDSRVALFMAVLNDLGVDLKLYDNLGIENRLVSKLLKTHFFQLIKTDSHASFKKNRSLLVIFYNIYAAMVRFFRGKKEALLLSFYHPLRSMRSELFFHDKYYPVISSLRSLGSIKNLIFSGAKVFSFGTFSHQNKLVDQLLEDYRTALEKYDPNSYLGEINFLNKTINIEKYLRQKLIEIEKQSFKQIIDNIELLDAFLRKNKVKGYLGFCDSPWQQRLIIRMCQKYNIPNAIIMNGHLGNTDTEGRTADTFLSYGEKYFIFEIRKKVLVVGNPLFDKAYKKRGKRKLNYPPRKILIGTFTFCPIDINCPYSYSETALRDILTVLYKLRGKFRQKIKISLKLHPAEEGSFYRWFLNENNFSDVEIISKGNFQSVMQDFDLLIITHSTAIFEAALMGIPVVFYHSNKQILPEPFNGNSCLPSAFNKEKLKEVLLRVFKDQNYAKAFTDLNVLEPFTGPMDGKANDRIMEIINGWFSK